MTALRLLRTVSFLALSVPGSLADSSSLVAAPADDVVMTNFTVLVGYPSTGSATTDAVLLIPGTVIPLESERLQPEGAAKGDLVDRSRAFSRAVSKLWETFRLDPARQIQKGMYSAARTGLAVNLPELEGTNIKLTATLISSGALSTTFRVVFTQGQKQLADSTVNVARGGRAVVGGTDGAAAPYIFVFVEPEAADSSPAKSGKQPGVTQPVLVRSSQPLYPEEAKNKKITGTVIVDLLVGADGRVEDAVAVESPDASLAKAAVDAIRTWEFQPARNEKGEPLRVKISVTVNFKLR